MESLKQIVQAMPARIDSTQDAVSVREWWKGAKVVIEQVDAGLAQEYEALETATYPVSPFINPVMTESEKAELIAQNPNEAGVLADFDREKRKYEDESAAILSALRGKLNELINVRK